MTSPVYTSLTGALLFCFPAELGQGRPVGGKSRDGNGRSPVALKPGIVWDSDKHNSDVEVYKLG